MAQNLDLLLISVDSPVLMGIYENKVLVKSFSAEGKFSDSLPKLFAEVLDFGAESALDSATRTPLISLDSFSQKGCTPRPAPPTRQKLPLFAFRGRASLSPLLAKNRRSHYCSLDSDFLHHEAGEISGASHGFNVDSAKSQNLVENSGKVAESAPDSANRRIGNIFYINGPGNFSAIKLTHIFLQTLSITKNIPLFCADAFHFSNNEFINAYGKVHFMKENGEIRTITIDSKRPNSFSLPQSLDLRIFSEDCAPLYILPAV